METAAGGQTDQDTFGSPTVHSTRIVADRRTWCSVPHSSDRLFHFFDWCSIFSIGVLCRTVTACSMFPTSVLCPRVTRGHRTIFVPHRLPVGTEPFQHANCFCSWAGQGGCSRVFALARNHVLWELLLIRSLLLYKNLFY